MRICHRIANNLQCTSDNQMCRHRTFHEDEDGICDNDDVCGKCVEISKLEYEMRKIMREDDENM